MPETRPIMPTAIDMIGCHAVANDATAATPVIVVSALAAESVCCIINYKDSNYSVGGNGWVTISNVLGVPRTTSNDSSKTIYQNCGVFNSAN